MKGKSLQATRSKDSAASSPLPSLNFREAQVLLCHLESAWLGLGHREWARRTQAEKDQTDFCLFLQEEQEVPLLWGLTTE